MKTSQSQVHCTICDAVEIHVKPETKVEVFMGVMERFAPFPGLPLASLGYAWQSPIRRTRIGEEEFFVFMKILIPNQIKIAPPLIVIFNWGRLGRGSNA